MASGSGDNVTRRSVASQFFTQEEGPGIDGMTTSERVSVVRRAGCSPWLERDTVPQTELGVTRAVEASSIMFLSPFQVVDLLNQAALITNDSKITVLKQVGQVGRLRLGGLHRRHWCPHKWAVCGLSKAPSHDSVLPIIPLQHCEAGVLPRCGPQSLDPRLISLD